MIPIRPMAMFIWDRVSRSKENAVKSSLLAGSSPQPMDLQYHSPYSSASSPSQAASVASPSLLSDDDDFVAHQQHIMNSMPPPVSRRWDEPEYWCSICYYELNSRVGEPFKVRSVPGSTLVRHPLYRYPVVKWSLTATRIHPTKRDESA